MATPEDVVTTCPFCGIGTFGRTGEIATLTRDTEFGLLPFFRVIVKQCSNCRTVQLVRE